MEFGHFFKAVRGRTGFSYLDLVGFGLIAGNCILLFRLAQGPELAAGLM
jgi:hypothetical protein